VPALGVTENLLASPLGQTRPVDLVGTVNAMGQQIWDWSTPDATDQLAHLTATTLSGKWYASSFPNGQFVTPIDLADTLEGVYVHTATDFELLGIASTQKNASDGETLVVYDTPVQLYRYPLKAGDSWTSVGVSRNAMLKGLSYAGTDTYEIAVDDAGILYLPSLTFTQAFRVQMTTTVAPAAGESAVTRQDSFLAECFGEIARATSQTNETQDNFTTAAEIRRLGLAGD